MRPPSLMKVLLALGALMAPVPVAPAQEERAVAAIAKLKGTVDRDEDAPGKPVVGASFYRSDGHVRDEDLDLLADLPHLKSVLIHCDTVTDAGLERLGRLRQLESLDLIRVRATDAGLAQLKGLSRLQRLHLVELPITDAGLAHLEGLKQLRTVDLRDTDVTDAGVARLKAALPYALIRAYRSDEPREGVLGWRVLAWAAGAGLALVGLVACVLLGAGWRWRLAAVVALVLVAGAAVLGLAPRMAPVREGDPGTFWLHVCGLDVGAKRAGSRGGYYLPRDGWFISYVQGFHGRRLYRVEAADAEAHFPEVVRRLEGAPAGFLSLDVEDGFRAWRASGAGPTDAAGFLEKVREARLSRAQKGRPDLYEYVLAEEDDFSERWERCRRYPAIVAFELVFFAGLVLFITWPWLRGGGPVRWAVHLGLAPLLFFLPYWLGYVPLAFTSAGPGGGVLYPGLLVQFRGLPWTGVDTAILRNVPPLLEPLAGSPGPIISISSFGGVGPVAGLALSLGVAIAVLVLGALARRAGDKTGPP